jgi:hypothetical protein
VETIRASVDQSGASNWPWDAETHWNGGPRTV